MSQGEGWKDLFDNTLLCADGDTIFESMLSQIDIWCRSSVLNGFDRPL